MKIFEEPKMDVLSIALEPVLADDAVSSTNGYVPEEGEGGIDW